MRTVAPITCYKIVRICPGKIESLFYDFSWEVGKQYVKDGGAEIDYSPNGDVEIHGNAFHTFVSEWSAKYLVKKLNNGRATKSDTYAVAVCEIPANRMIYYGNCNLGNGNVFQSYASNELTIKNYYIVA